MAKLFCIDFCQTLVTVDSLPRFIKFVCFKEKGMRTLLYVYYWFLGRLGFVVTKEQRLALLSGIHSKRLAYISKEYAENILLPNMNVKLVEYVESHKKDGDKKVIVSAALSDYIRPLAKSIGIDEIIAAELEVDQKNLTTGKTVQPLVFGEEKVEKLDKYLSQYAKEAWYTIAFSDSHHDLPMLLWADEAVVISGLSDTLMEEAKEKNWSVI